MKIKMRSRFLIEARISLLISVCDYGARVGKKISEVDSE